MTCERSISANAIYCREARGQGQDKFLGRISRGFGLLLAIRRPSVVWARKGRRFRLIAGGLAHFSVRSLSIAEKWLTETMCLTPFFRNLQPSWPPRPPR